MDSYTDEHDVTVSSYSGYSKVHQSEDSDKEDEFVQIVDVLEPEVIVLDRINPPDSEEEETKQKLETLLQKKLEENRKEAELMRMQTFEENRKKRQSIEKELLRKIEKNRMKAENELRFSRHKQEEEEMLRESHGDMDEILSGRGGPLRALNYGLLGGPDATDMDDTDITSTYF